MAYREVERALRISGERRLQGTAILLADFLDRTVSTRLDESRKLAASPVLRAYLRDRNPASAAAALRILQAAIGTARQAEARLYRPDGSIVLRTGGDDGDSDPPRGLPPAGVSALTAHEGRVSYTTTTMVPDESTDLAPIGALAIARTATGAPASALAPLEQLIGSGVSLRIGNVAGDVWTNLAVQVASCAATPVGQASTYVDEHGVAFVGATARIRSAPWLVCVESARSAVMAPARTLLQRMIPISLGVTVLGGLLVYAASSRLTRPIQRLAVAADGIAAGDYARRVTVRKPVELARLGEAFNLMATRVEESHAALEHRVQERTCELEEALAALKRTQDELVVRERLAMLGQLSSSVGHELRNPLGVMTNAIYFLDMVQTDASEEVREYLGILRHQVALAEKIVGDLLDFARLKPPQVQTVSVSQLVQEQVSRLRGSDRLTIEQDLHPDLPEIRVDPVQIGQVLFNVLSNAQQAMDGTGSVRLWARTAEDLLELHVTDSGPGVAPDLLDKIFQPLFTTKARGIGLGLAVSRSLAEANGGRLTVTSPPGRGATFTIALPVAVAVLA
jgi:signal transduction histidine kinase